MSEKTISSAVEDYLKAIYALGGEVKTQDLADALEVSPASVSGMLKKLAALKLVEYERYRGVRLTNAGTKMALETIRHHRLIETYLARALGFSWDEVHDEAERLEHHISEAFEAKIAQALGHPTHDPHGDPIPQLDGTMPTSHARPLTDFAADTRVSIARITQQRPEVLQYLAERRLTPGREVRVVAQEPFNGPVTLACGDARIVIASALARTIYAERITEGSSPPRRHP